MNTLLALQMTSGIIKFILTVLIGGYGLAVLRSEADPGVKAAALALCTACVLLLDWIPRAGPYWWMGSLATRSVGALLAFAAGWHWLIDEVGETPWEYLWPAGLYVGGFGTQMVLSTILLHWGRKQAKPRTPR